jgi:hypothetical protein
MDQITPTLKLSVLYGKPHDPAAFEAHCLGTHMPLVAATPAPARAEASCLAPTDRRHRSTDFSKPGSIALNISLK